MVATKSHHGSESCQSIAQPANRSLRPPRHLLQSTIYFRGRRRTPEAYPPAAPATNPDKGRLGNKLIYLNVPYLPLVPFQCNPDG